MAGVSRSWRTCYPGLPRGHSAAEPKPDLEPLMRRLSPPSPGWLFFIASLVAFAIGAFATMAAHARSQSLQPPFDYPPTLTTTPVQVLPLDPARRRIVFINPSATASIAFCPTGVTRAGVPFACAVNGAGSITLLPLGSFILDGGTPQGPPLAMSAAWFGVSNGAGAPATVLEFE
jgi:hypothetical protein